MTPALSAGSAGSDSSGIGCVLGLLYILYTCFCLYMIARKVGVDAPYLAFFPLLNLITLVQASGRSALWVLALMIPGLNLVAAAWFAMGLAEQRGREPLLGLLILVPVVQLVFLGYLAFVDPPGSPPRVFRDEPRPAPPRHPSPIARPLLGVDGPTERCAGCGTPYTVRTEWWSSGGFCSEACYRRAEEADGADR